MTAIDFLTSLPSKVNPDALAGISTCLHFDLDEGGIQKTVKVEGGKLEVLDGLQGTSTCTVKTKSETLVKLVKGEENPMMAFMMGKIKVSNPGELMKYSKMLGLM